MNLPFDPIQTIRDLVRSQNPEQGWIADNVLFLHVAGSRLYGTASVSSDFDIRGVTLAPKSYWVGARRFDQFEAKVPELDLDVVIYDFRRWLKLTVDVNPNVVETLYVKPNNECVLWQDPHWGHISARVRDLISQRAYDGYHGYASSQIKKMLVKQSNKTGRREIADAHGMDVKFGAHGFRLVSQGIELLTNGDITFPRPDADRLRAIRNGEVYGPYQTDLLVADWEKESAGLAQALVDSVLPEKANFEDYDRLLMQVFDVMVNGVLK